MTYNREHPLYIEDLDIFAHSFDYETFRGKTILITGATGLIGTFLVDALMHINNKENCTIKVLALGRNISKAKERFLPYWGNKSFSFVEQDICLPLGKVECDYVIHTASNAHPAAYKAEPVGTILTNVEGTRNVLDLCARTGCKMLMLSTVEVYGQAIHSDDVFAESYQGIIDLQNPRSCYPESKRLAEVLCQAYNAQFGVDVKIARLCRTFGPTMTLTDSKATAQFLRKAKKQENIILKSSGEQPFSYCYVADACSALFHILLHGKTCNPYNISSTKCDCCLKDFATLAAEIGKCRLVFDIPKEYYLTDGSSNAISGLLDSSALMELGWVGKYKLEDAIHRTINIIL